jgi:predicted esterase
MYAGDNRFKVFDYGNSIHQGDNFSSEKVTSMLNDFLSKVDADPTVDKNHLFASGYSAGATWASSVALAQQNNNRFAGVIRIKQGEQDESILDTYLSHLSRKIPFYLFCGSMNSSCALQVGSILQSHGYNKDKDYFIQISSDSSHNFPTDSTEISTIRDWIYQTALHDCNSHTNHNGNINTNTNTNNNSDNNTNVNSQNENNNALPPTHHICQNQSCIEVNGDGMDTCTSDNDCVVPTYHICQNHMCVEQIGTGTDRCTSDEECQDQLQNLYIITNPFNGLMVGYEVSNNMVVLHVTPSSGSHSWFLRGTSGGKLDTYTGDRVIYTPGSVAGEDVISVSDGTNKAYVDIKVTYAGNTPRFDMKTTNMVVQQGIFPLNVSVGADVKETISFKALAEYKDPATGAVTYRDVTGSATWTSGNTEIGKIDATGMLLAIKPGTTRVSALFDSVTSNAITVYVNPTFPGVNPSTYEARFNPNPVAKGYSTRLWVFVESDSGNAEDIRIVSADLSNLNIAPVCTGSGTTIENCQSLWMMTPAQQENHGRWYYMDIRVPFTVADGTYPIRIAATNNEGNIDRHFSLSLRVVAEVKKGDVNGDGQLSIADAVLALQVAVHKVEETDPKVNITADVNGDGHIGLPEAIYVLKQLTLSSL